MIDYLMQDLLIEMKKIANCIEFINSLSEESFSKYLYRSDEMWGDLL